MANSATYLTDPVYYGSTPKFLLSITSGTLSMDDYDFQVRLQRGSNSVTIEKDEMVTDGNGNYYVCVDTTLLGAGMVQAAVIADIPDNDYESGTRTEIVVFEKFMQIIAL